MRDWKLKRVSWFVIVPVLLVAVLVCVVCYQRDNASLRGLNAQAGELRVQISENQAETESLREQMENLGTTAQLETEARKQDFIKSGELLFEVVNEELLDNYTKEEWTILMEERKLGQF